MATRKILGCEVKRVLIIRCGALGDLVYATSVIDALKMQYGEDTLIDFVCTPGSGTLFKCDPRVNTVFPLKHKKIPLFFSKQKKEIIKASKNKAYDLLINFEFGKQFRSLATKIYAKQKVGAFFEKIKFPVNINRALLQKEFFSSVVDKNIIENTFPNIATEDFTPLQTKFSLNKDYIVLAPSNSHVNRSGINYRAWDTSKWIELIQTLSKKRQVIIVGAQKEELFFQKLMPYPDNVIDLVAKNSVTELSSIIKHAKAVVCTDSAVGHISAAVNTPVFVLMGPNDIVTDSPYQTPYNSVHVISLNLDCSPCYKTDVMKKCQDNVCMKEISVIMVYNHLQLTKSV